MRICTGTGICTVHTRKQWMGGSADKRDWNKLNAGGDKKGREVEFSREEFPNNLQTVTVAVEEGSDKRDQGPIQCSGGQV